MDEEGREQVRANASGVGADWLRKLPESLQWHVLLKLPTKDVVKASVVYSKWRHLWRYVPGLDLDCRDFKEYNVVVKFIDGFLSFNSESSLEKFKIRYDSVLDADDDGDEQTDNANVTRWINAVVKRHVKQLGVVWGEVVMPPSLYMCESLVSLKLSDAILPNLESVSLPSVKVLDLVLVKFANDLAFERLISGCIVLESLVLYRSPNDNVKVLHVSSKSLLSFIYNGSTKKGPLDDLVVSVDAPRLEDLQLSDHLTESFVVSNMSSLVRADIQINFSFEKAFDPTDLRKRNMIRKFLAGISCVKNLILAQCTLEVIYKLSKCEPLPVFRNLASLTVDFYENSWETLPVFLHRCPNLNSLIVESTTFPEEGASILTGPPRLLSSLEYVKIESPLEGDAMEMKFVRYLLENSPILKKLTLRLDNGSRKNSAIVRELLKIPRLSSSCQVIVL
ncbi:hypothetical protein CARUB_v10021747mg [Capsella rubella]|uniref:FBD domain-containing protein n=1 Tax=Capsella rubella TaxID=81985 RepID=R0I803_9BRAS|nr:FBD-associated F-box protein At1g66310 [Capsella rubella]EOA34235.1 hypothetical protein CARUB_v10021747mg [Capsella rubella]